MHEWRRIYEKAIYCNNACGIDGCLRSSGFRYGGGRAYFYRPVLTQIIIPLHFITAMTILPMCLRVRIKIKPKPLKKAKRQNSFKMRAHMNLPHIPMLIFRNTQQALITTEHQTNIALQQTVLSLLLATS